MINSKRNGNEKSHVMVERWRGKERGRTEENKVVMWMNL
jgi:hypothetical protein